MNDPTLDLFLAACGSDEPLRLGVAQRDTMELATHAFAKPFVVIGRAADADLVLDHWQVSRRHAYLQLIEGRYYCVDLGSRTGTHGGDVAKRSGWIENGRTIQIGPYAVRPEPPTSRDFHRRHPPSVTWELPGQAIGQSTWKMDRYMAMIGRSPACKIRILEADVSKFHCSVVLTPHGLWAIDLLGENGVFLNDRKIRCARIDEGDELRIGSHVLRPHYDQPPLPLPTIRPEQTGSDSSIEILTTHVLPTASFGSAMAPNVNLPARLPMPQIMTGEQLGTMLEKAGGGAIDPSVNLLVHQFGMMQQNMLDQFHNTMMMMFEGFAALHREQAASIREEFEHVRKLSDEIESLRTETAKLARESAARPLTTRPPQGQGVSSAPPPPANGHANPRPFIPRPQPARTDAEESDIHAQLCAKLSSIETERQNRWQKILGMMTAKA